MDLSTLSATELKRLLRTAHASHDGVLADRLEWEIASRAAEEARAMNAPQDPFGEPPAEYEDAEYEDYAEHGTPDAPRVGLGAQHSDSRAIPAFRTFATDEPLETTRPRLHRSERLPQPRPGRPLPPADSLTLAGDPEGRTRPAPRTPARNPGLLLFTVGLLGGCLISGAAFYGLGGVKLLRHEPSADTAPLRMMTARIGPHETGALPPVDPEAEAAATEAALAAAAPAKPLVIAKATPKPQTRRTAARPTVNRNDPCASAEAPADHVVCNDLELSQLSIDLREAYARALNAQADPEIVDQTEWRRARDSTTDPQRLAKLYDHRIRELNAATVAAAARRADPPY